MDHGRQFHAARCESLGAAGLAEFANAVITRGAEYGVNTLRDMLAVFDLAMVFGLDWSTPEHRWLHEGMSDRAYPDMASRLKRLRRKAIYKLEAAAAKKAGGA